MCGFFLVLVHNDRLVYWSKLLFCFCPLSFFWEFFSRRCSFHECYFYHRSWGEEKGWAVITLSLLWCSFEASHLNRHFAFGNFLFIWRNVTSWTILSNSSSIQYAIYKVAVILSMLKTLFFYYGLIALSGPRLRHCRGFAVTYNTIC
jgi:hypothetical protein